MRQHTLAACLQTLRRHASWASIQRALSEATPLTVLLLLVVLASLFRYLHALVKILVEAPFIDFAHYYTYAMLISLGLDPFDPQAVAQVDALLHIRRAEAVANYPPLFYLLMQPWVLLPFRHAAVAWFFLNQLCLIGAFALCFRLAASPTTVKTVTVLFVWLNYQPLIENLALGQSNAVVLFLVTLAWWGLRTNHPWVAAAAVAVTVHIKLQYGLLFVLLWWIGYRKVSIRALVLAGLGLGIGLFILGPAHHVEYVRYLLSLPEYLAAWTANLSLRGMLHRLISPSDNGRLLVDGLTLLLDLLVLGLLAWRTPRNVSADSTTVDWVWGLGLALILLLSPLTEEHHLIVLLLPLMLLLLNEPPVPLPAREMAVLIGSVLLLGSRYSLEQFSAFHHGALSLFATGKLLGVIGLAWVLIFRLRAERTPA